MPSTNSDPQQLKQPLKLIRHKPTILTTTLLLLLLLYILPLSASQAAVSIRSTNGTPEPARSPFKPPPRGSTSSRDRDQEEEATAEGDLDNCTCARELLEVRKEVEEERAQRRQLKGTLETYVSELYDLRAMVRSLKEAGGRGVAASKLSSSSDAPATPTPAISFSAKLSFNQELKPLDTIIFDTVNNNNGQAYNAETGKFTTPLPGTYLFFSTILSGYNTKVEAALIVNDKEVTRIYAGAHDAHGSGSNAAVVSLRSGDSVCVRLLHQGGSHVHGYYSTFSGAMLSHQEQPQPARDNVAVQLWAS